MRFLTVALLFLIPLSLAQAGDKDIKLTLRKQVSEKTTTGEVYKQILVNQQWSPKSSAVIVVDMWDTHHCYNAVQRVVEMAPRMNEVLEKCRGMGMTIIHAPSSCMDAYKGHPGRKRAMDAPKAKNRPKDDITVWCQIIDSEKKNPYAKGKYYPIDASDGGCDSDPMEQEKHKQALIKVGQDRYKMTLPDAQRFAGGPWKSQYHVLKMHDIDIVSDKGNEIWNVLEDRKINNVIILGVHTNMCVLGRPFGLRQLAKNGKNVVLMRDMTDTMYNPKMSPYVNHYKGTELIVEHIEKFVCPTITSDQIIGGKSFKFKADPN